MGKHLKSIRVAVLVVAAAVLISGVSYKIGVTVGEKKASSASTVRILRNTDVPSSISVDFSLFWDVWQRINLYWIDASKIDTQKLVWGAITGMVNALDDPYTIFLPPKENKEFKEDIAGSFQGIGAQLGTKDEKIIIVAPLSGSPAEKAGIKAMDWIMKVNGEDTLQWTVTQAVSKIRGSKGTKVTLTILHEKSDTPVEVTIIRDEIIVPSVESWIKTVGEIDEVKDATISATLRGNPGKVAYIYLSRFGDRTNEEWDSAVKKVNAAIIRGEVKGLILDLRNNPGGYLDGSVFIAGEFLKDGRIVTQTNSDGTKQDYDVDRHGLLYDIPLVVLINKGSASAAEIVAGALKDRKRATIVGETSFGKGSVQTPQELDGGAGIHITTGKWLLPSGNWINKIGVAPDIEVKTNGETTDIQLAKAIEVLLK